MPSFFQKVWKKQDGEAESQSHIDKEGPHTAVLVGKGSHKADQDVGKTNFVADEPERSLSWVQCFALWVNMLFMGSQLFLPYTLAAYMVRDFAKGRYSEQTIGQLTGLLAASSSFARSVTAFCWGLLSDRAGRKFVILVGNVAGMASLLGLGGSTSYLGAILARALPSLFIGSPVAIKSMMGDACDQVGQAKAMSIFNLGHGLGTVIGPILGGVLSRPCDRFSGMPMCKPGELLQTRPYLLPCLTVALMGVLALLSNVFLLRETHPDLVDTPGGWYGNLLRLLCCRRQRPRKQKSWLPSDDPVEEGLLSHASSLSRRSTADLEMGARPSLRASLAANNTLPRLTEQPVDKAAASLATPAPQNQLTDSSPVKGDSKAILHASAQPSTSLTGDGPSRNPPAGPWEQPGKEPLKLQYQSVLPEDQLLEASGATSHKELPGARTGQNSTEDAEGDEESTALLIREREGERREEVGKEASSSGEHGSSKGELQPWYKDRNTRLALVGSGMIAFLYNLGDELTPIFVSAPADIGGLNMPLDQFTWPIAAGGVTLVVFSLAFYPRLMKRFGGLVLCRAGLLGGIPSAILVPCASLFLHMNPLKQTCLFVAMGLKSMAKVMALNSSMILVNLIAPKASMGAVNGLNQTLQSGGRALGPLLSGTMWAIVVSMGFAGQQFIGFAVLALALAATQYIYVFLTMPTKK